MTGVPRPALVLIGLALTAAATAAQQPLRPQASPATGGGLVLGRTVDASTGKPLAGVEVNLNLVPTAVGVDPSQPTPSLGRFPMRALSNADGQVVFRDLPKGHYGLTATRAGYVSSQFGRQSAADVASHQLVLADNDKRGDVTLRLWKHASLSGVVVDEAGEPIIAMQVRVYRRTSANGRVTIDRIPTELPTTDDRGMFRAGSLTPGDYLVGVVSTRATVPQSLIDAGDAANRSGNSLEFSRELQRSSSANVSGGQRVGQWVLQTGLGPGGQALVAPPAQSETVFVYPSIFYPAETSIAQATIIRLTSGEERAGLDFRLRPVAALRVSGQLQGPAGPEPHTGLDLVPTGTIGLTRDIELAAGSTVTDPSGTFTFLGVTPGSYEIRVLKTPRRPDPLQGQGTVIQTGTTTITSFSGSMRRPPVSDEPTFWGRAAVTVADRDVSGVSVTLRPGGRVTGRMEFEGTAAKPDATRVAQATVRIDNVDGNLASQALFLSTASVDESGAFKSYQVPVGRYVVRASGNLPGWTFKGAFLDGRDISDGPIEIAGADVSDVVVVFTDRTTEVTGAVRDTRGPDPAATVIAFPAQPAAWTNLGPSPRRMRSVRANSDGTFRIANLPPGDYVLLAYRSDGPADWQDPAFLKKAMALGVRVTLADGEKTSQELPTREVR